MQNKRQRQKKRKKKNNNNNISNKNDTRLKNHSNQNNNNKKRQRPLLSFLNNEITCRQLTLRSHNKKNRVPIEKTNYSPSNYISINNDNNCHNNNNNKSKNKKAVDTVKNHSTIWEKFFRRIKTQVHSINQNLHFVYTYEHNGWKNASKEKLKPLNEIRLRQEKIVNSKLKIRNIIHELCKLNENDEKIIKLMKDDGNDVPFDEIYCSRCKTNTSDESNDLILCDYKGCYRAFHQNCQSPVIKKDEFDNDYNDDWFCRQCECKYDLLEYLNDVFDEKWNDIEEVFSSLEEKDEKKKEVVKQRSTYTPNNYKTKNQIEIETTSQNDYLNVTTRSLHPKDATRNKIKSSTNLSDDIKLNKRDTQKKSKIKNNEKQENKSTKLNEPKYRRSERTLKRIDYKKLNGGMCLEEGNRGNKRKDRVVNNTNKETKKRENTENLIQGTNLNQKKDDKEDLSRSSKRCRKRIDYKELNEKLFGTSDSSSSYELEGHNMNDDDDADFLLNEDSDTK